MGLRQTSAISLDRFSLEEWITHFSTTLEANLWQESWATRRGGERF